MPDAPRPADDEIADAGLLFGDSSAKPSSPSPKAARGPVIPDSDAGYDLDESKPDELEEQPAPVRVPVQESRTRPATERAPKRRGEDEAPVEFDQVWSRWGEWSSSVLALAVAVPISAWLLYMTLMSIGFGAAFLLALVCLGVVVVLAYPMLITLERPVRLTPERAAKDYYDALSHVRPHYRRMWLLLGPEARNSATFSSFMQFSAYWKQTLSRLRANRAKQTAALTFEVVDFKGEKSSGKSVVDGKFTVQVKAKGAEGEQVLESVRVSSVFHKGPDGMWYLENGALAE